MPNVEKEIELLQYNRSMHSFEYANLFHVHCNYLQCILPLSAFADIRKVVWSAPAILNVGIPQPFQKQVQIIC